MLREVILEEHKVACADGLAERLEDGLQGARGLGPVEQRGRGEAAEEHVGGDEVGEDVCAVGDELGRGL